ncbi:MAG TPA: ATP-binding protein [Acetobacteraceae bacterium]
MGRRTLIPKTLAGRTLLVLLPGLAVVQGAGLAVHAVDRGELQRLADGRDLAGRVLAAYRTVTAGPPEGWAAAARALDAAGGLHASVEPAMPQEGLDPAPPDVQRLIRPYLFWNTLPPLLRPREVTIRDRNDADMVLSAHLPDERWLVLRGGFPALWPWASARFAWAWAGMTLGAAALTLWAVRRLTAPVRLLGAAAERLGRDVNAPALPEDGPEEVAQAAAAFNTMAGRIRRFVTDRTFLLTAIGHDLRTPITRLRLRAEWMEDEEQRTRMLADLDELQAMVSATLAFGRDVAGTEPAVPLDLVALLRTVLDEAADARPAAAGCLAYAGPDRLQIQGRPVALKRALANLVGNAVAYGGAARVTLLSEGRPGRGVVVQVEDSGPGIPPDELDRVFEPFHRVEGSRNRETGGTGLGLPITRNILRAHGGDVALANLDGGGVRATVTLPG